MNIEHMKQVREFIQSLPPDSCDMTDWSVIAFDEEGGERVTFTLMKERGFACGSAACIAGWTAMLSTGKTAFELDPATIGYESFGGTPRIAREYLDIERGDAEKLFCQFPENTPEEGWQTWMIARLDDCIEAGYITAWNSDDDDDDYSDDEPIDDGDSVEDE